MLVCRTCLARKDLSPLFSERSCVKFDRDQLFKATGLQMKEDDGLPQVACKACLRGIRKVLNFKEICKKSDKILRNISMIITTENFRGRSIYHDMINGTESENPLFNALFNLANDNSNNDGLDNDNLENDNDNSGNVGIDNDNTENDNESSGNDSLGIPENDNEQSTTHIQMDLEKLESDTSDIDKDDVLISYQPKIPITNATTKSKTLKTLKTGTSQNKKTQSESIKPSKTERKVAKTKLGAKADIEGSVGSQNIVTVEEFEATDSEKVIEDLDFYLDDISHEGTPIWTTEARIDDDIKKLRNTAKTRKNGVEKPKIFNEFQERNKKYMALGIPHKTVDWKTPIECRKCHKVMAERASFLAHAKIHFEPEFICEVCGKRFRSRNHMGYHQQRQHGRVKRLACTQCEFRAVEKTTLLNHVRLEHTGERPFICAECGGTFRMRRAIVQHMRTHFAVNNIQCERCPALLKTRSELWRHRNMVHLMSYTYPCYLCSDSYKSRGATKKHLLKVHGLPIDQQVKVACVKLMK